MRSLRDGEDASDGVRRENEQRGITKGEVEFYLNRAHQLRAEAFCNAVFWVGRKLRLKRRPATRSKGTRSDPCL